MNSVFLRNGRYAAHVTLWLGPLFCDFGEEMFKSRRSDIHEHADRLIGVIFESGIGGVWPNACSVRPWSARIKRELPSR